MCIIFEKQIDLLKLLHLRPTLNLNLKIDSFVKNQRRRLNRF